MTLRILLGDQLGQTVSSLQDASHTRDVILMAELEEEATYVKHHKKKITFLFAAMRNFAQELREKGFQVIYLAYQDQPNIHSFKDAITYAFAQIGPRNIVVTEPGEYRLLEEMKHWASHFQVEVDIREDSRFLASHAEFQAWAEGRKTLRMEYFYREMRRKYNILMEGDQPIGGQWNFDASNRKPPATGLSIPPPFMAEETDNLTSAKTVVAQAFPDHFGDIEPFYFATTSAGAKAALAHFITHRLPLFGQYQDAMIEGEPWMFHSHISFYINAGLLCPKEAIDKAEAAYHAGHAPIEAVEGFIRQILGWREYIRGIYWLKMPEYKELNFLNATRKLPSFYWDGNTQMNCLRQCVIETKENAYAHHIQRLMVLGNFALLAGISPTEVNEWFLIVYADAYEWVELPNVTGMILYADGGQLGSKPYAASGAYINRMSTYCKGCSYQVSKKNGPKACPFNYLYWNFLVENEDVLARNPRMSLAYKNLARLDDDRVSATKDDAARFLKSLEE